MNYQLSTINYQLSTIKHAGSQTEILGPKLETIIRLKLKTSVLAVHQPFYISICINIRLTGYQM